MSWHCSRALVEAFSAANCSDGQPSAQLNTTPTPDQFYWPDKTTEHSRLSRFGMTCVPLTASHGEELLTWFLADSRAKTSVQQVRAPASKVSEADCGAKWQGSFAKYSRDSSSWKTAQCSLLADSDAFSETWPRWGSMRNGVSYLRQIPAHHICANESGLWATPTTMDKLPPKSLEALHREATIARPGRSKPANLRDQVSNMKNWPTPCARDYRSHMKLETVAKRKEESTRGVNLSEQMQRVTGTTGQLNPEWVEWLMGWPIGWTALKPLETAKFQEWQQQHGIF